MCIRDRSQAGNQIGVQPFAEAVAPNLGGEGTPRRVAVRLRTAPLKTTKVLIEVRQVVEARFLTDFPNGSGRGQQKTAGVTNPDLIQTCDVRFARS